MPQLKTIPRPKGRSGDYLFLVDQETGQAFKAKHSLRMAEGAQPAVTISLSPVGPDGKALHNAAGRADITTLTHTFTEVELADPDFDEQARVADILARLAAEKQNEIAARGRVLLLGDRWGHGALDLSRRLPTPDAGDPS